MPVPKQKTSRKRRGDRRKHLALKPFSLVKCSQCTASILAHRVCPHCGYYKGREVLLVGKPDKGTEKNTSRGNKKDLPLKKKDSEPESPDKPLTMEELSKKT